MLCALDYADLSGDSDVDLAEWCEAATKDEPSMHVRITPNKADAWHKMLIDRTRTACGKILGAYATRDESYAGNLCKDGCFSPYELALATKQLEELVERRRTEKLRAADEASVDTHLVDEIAKSRTESQRRLDLATGRHPRIDPDDDK